MMGHRKKGMCLCVGRVRGYGDKAGKGSKRGHLSLLK